MSKILALDTAADACSVALWLDGEIVSDHRLLPREHTKMMLLMIEQLLADHGVKMSDLDGIAYGRGPGSFTGLRICGGIVQGLAFGAGLPVVAVSSLAALAYPYIDEQRAVIACVDARMGELYTGVFGAKGQDLISLSDELLIKPEQMKTSMLYAGVEVSDWQGVGSGWGYREHFGDMKELELMVDSEALPTAAAVVALAMKDFELGQTVTAADVSPIYLRDSVAWQKTT
ncbi:tRNA threonylcarbamoyladenosine biosynthesis protein TsaB [Sinobacterium caligoides]|uniref:tRNA threonylcarbamoyladenosine biosynthesis protein TsaB n=1 Tax=Sinobacterium caligoides TaxID=933926 RepID=A0A3N2DXZ5_9GAMM|nr:tRNA (adenosine(37)-N6)-threonylcarbamoyltransferase complex dimerization subunit type 1 TsaB [Sinobacterium caligoides]ROS04703.1 tRNA threonylcarbamoyladenosine biosynthesis protein TsaB [Sinobacterium caligoides]